MVNITDKIRILVIEDDESIAHALRLELTHANYEVTIVNDGLSGLTIATNNDWGLILLDLMLPGMSGNEICKSLRKVNIITPIIMLTAKSDVFDKVSGLDIGADDYITKPFVSDELLARIRACLRRQPESQSKECLSVSNISLDSKKHKVTQAGKTIELTKREFDLLKCLMRHPNQVLSRESLLNNVWGYDFDGELGIVDVYISYLRAKIEQPPNSHIIHTVRGVGFILGEDNH